MNEKAYSVSGDDWKCDFLSATEDLIQELEVGDVFEVQEGDAVRVPIEKFIDAKALLEQIADNAAENYSEHAELFCNSLGDCNEATSDLQMALDMLIKGWAQKHQKDTDFFEVENITAQFWRVIDPDNFEVEPEYMKDVRE